MKRAQLQAHVARFLAGQPGLGAALQGGEPLLVGVSGGPDSLALLHALLHCGRLSPQQLLAVHVDHGLRATSGREAQWVAALLARWGVPGESRAVNVPAFARAHRLSLEEAARNARYAALAECARENGAHFVAVAHQADDQAETVLMHLLRGAGLAGLRGMLPASPLAGDPSLTLLRPFLDVSRAAILAYCQAQRLQPLQDQSNLSLAFFRNRLRHQLLPELARYNPGIKQRLRQLATLAAADYALLHELSRQQLERLVRHRSPTFLELDLAGWQALPLALRRGVLRQAAAILRPELRDLGFRALEQARRVAEKGEVGGQAILPAALPLTVGYDSLWLGEATGAVAGAWPQMPAAEPLPLPLPGRVALAGGWRLVAEAVAHPPGIGPGQDRWTAFVSLPPGMKLQVRPRLPGERFQPLGMGGRSAKVKEVMINRKLPASLRPLWPIVAGERHLVWLVGHHLDERVRVDAGSQHIWRLHCQRP